MILQHHRDKLVACGLTSETWSRARLHSGSVEEVKSVLGYGGAGTGLVIPYNETYARVRIDNPSPDGKRYRSPRGQGNRLYVPPAVSDSVLEDASVPLHVTEGEFKALKATQEGFPCVALPGVWSWKTRLHGVSLTIPDLDRVAWSKRRVIVVFDSDLAEKPPVAWAEHMLCQELRARGAEVFVLRLPDGPKGEKLGLDDYLVARGVEAFKQLRMQGLAEADQAEDPIFLRVSDLADAYLLSALRPHNRIVTGYAPLDRIVRGVAPGEVMQILGRSGVGKTAFLLNLIRQMTAGDIPTLFFSLEQQGVEIFERMASLTTGLYGREIERRAREEDPELSARLLSVCMAWQNVVIVEKPCTLDQLDRLIAAARAADFWGRPLRLVALDYIGLIGARRQATPYEHVSESAKELKRLAKRHRLAVVSLCQVGRDGESGGEPVTLRSGRDSGVLEEAADYVLGIWRPELSDRKSREDRAQVRGQFKVRVLKNRGGPAPRTVTLEFEHDTLRVTAPELQIAGVDE